MLKIKQILYHNIRESFRLPAVRTALIFFFVILGGLSHTTQAHANMLMAYPTRIVLEGRDRSAELTIINQSAAEMSYRVDIEDYVMDPEMGSVRLEEGETYPYSAKELIRLSPRRVTLPPGTNQKVRLLVRKPSDLADGEYRTHIRIKSIQPPEKKRNKKNSANSFSVTIEPRMNLVVPVTIRHGETFFTASITDIEPQVDKETNTLTGISVAVGKEGNRSLIGDLELFYQPPGDGKETMISSVKGLVVYREAPYRRLLLHVDKKEAIKLQSGGALKAKLYYIENKDKGRKFERGDVIAETTLPL